MFSALQQDVFGQSARCFWCHVPLEAVRVCQFLGWGGGDVNVPCTCAHVGCYARCWVGVGGMLTFLALAPCFWPVSKMFLASQQDVFGQSTRCFLASQQGPVTGLVGQVGVFGKSPGCSWTVGQFLAGLGLAFTMTLINYVFLRQCKGRIENATHQGYNPSLQFSWVFDMTKLLFSNRFAALFSIGQGLRNGSGKKVLKKSVLFFWHLRNAWPW